MSKVEFRVHLDDEIFGQESFPENNEFVSVGPVGTEDLSAEFDADVRLDLGEGRLGNVLLDGDEGWELSWELVGSLLAGISSSQADIDLPGAHVHFPEVVDARLGSLHKYLLDTAHGLEGLDRALLTDERNGVDLLDCWRT